MNSLEFDPDTSAPAVEDPPCVRARPDGSVSRLTPRERQAVELLAKGFYYREIGHALGIRTSTVRAHLHSAYRKLQVPSRARAVIKLQETGCLYGFS